MSTLVDQAVEFYDKACRAEEQSQMNLAEIYYLKSCALFEQVGGAHTMNAANVLNALAFLRWSRKDYEGALRSLQASLNIMETQGARCSSADADFIRSTAWELMDQIQYEMSLISVRRENCHV